jgi:hypothetical protein
MATTLRYVLLLKEACCLFSQFSPKIVEPSAHHSTKTVNNSLHGAEPSSSAQMPGFDHGGAYSSASTGHRLDSYPSARCLYVFCFRSRLRRVCLPVSRAQKISFSCSLLFPEGEEECKAIATARFEAQDVPSSPSQPVTLHCEFRRKCDATALRPHSKPIQLET